jgi:DUF4097 and DUF4098 domain-containing protein YvlB
MASEPQQRRSIFGGLLLILIGVVFLLHEHYPDMHLAPAVRHYWPVILIVWGLAKLFDNFAAQQSGETKPPIITGGELALILLFVVAVGGIAASEKFHDHFRWNWGDTVFSQKYSETEEVPVHPIKPGAQVNVATDRGNVTVYADETNSLRVVANKTASASTEEQARRHTQSIRISVKEIPGGYEIRPGASDSFNGIADIDLEVHLPKQVNLIASTAHGDITVSDTTGSLHASAASGNVEISGVSGNVNVDLQGGTARVTGIKGNVQITGHGNEVEATDVTGDAAIDGEFYGPIRLQDVKQSVTYTSARTKMNLLHLNGQMEMDSGSLDLSDVAGDAEITTHNRDIQIEKVVGRLRVVNSHGDVEVHYEQPPRDEISLANDSGGVDLTLPGSSGFEISASSRSGEIDNEFDDPALQESDQNGDHSLVGKHGTHGPKIHIATTYGTISLHQGA